MTLSDEIINTVLDVILPAVLSLLAAYAAYGINKAVVWLNTKTQEITDEQQRMLLYDALRDVSELTHKTVSTIEQTTAKALRERVKAGLASPEELTDLAKQALVEIRMSLSPNARYLVGKHFGNIDAYIRKSIETKVFELKQSGQGAS